MRTAFASFQLYRQGGSSVVWWRLIGANGRPLGAAPAPLASSDAVLERIALIRDNADDLTSSLRTTETNRWRWTLSLEGEEMATGGDHDRRVRCEMAWQRFVLVSPVALIDPAVHTFTVGRRASGGAAARVAPALSSDAAL